jgi:hypothetical protein
VSATNKLKKVRFYPQTNRQTGFPIELLPSSLSLSLTLDVLWHGAYLCYAVVNPTVRAGLLVKNFIFGKNAKKLAQNVSLFSV